jgi:SAM-dependent methyltransferase
MEFVTCILCDTADSTIAVMQRDVNLGRGEEFFTLVRCDGCGLIYLNPRPTPLEIHAYYPMEYYPLEETRARKAIDRFFKRLSNVLKKGIMQEFYGYPEPPGTRRSGFGRALRRLALFPEYWHLKFAGRDIIPFRGEGRILDVGCGPGKVLRVLREQGWDAYGVDFSSVAVEYARSMHGLNVTLGDLFEAAYKDTFFDVVLFNHALEHMYNPVETLREVYRILKPGGLLLINIPNAGSFEARVFGKWWVQWDVPRHLFHFTKETMARLLARTGFRLAEIKDGVGTSFFLGSIDYIYKYVLQINGRHGKFMRHFVAGPICLLAGHLGYGSEMKVYAQKPFEL